MPRLIDFRNHPQRKQFYHNVFSIKFKVKITKEIQAVVKKHFAQSELTANPKLLKKMGNRLLHPGDVDQFSVGLFIANTIGDVHVALLNQPPKLRTEIIKLYVDGLVEVLKVIYNNEHPHDKQNDIEKFWNFMHEAMTESIQTNYDETTTTEYLINTIIYESLYFSNDFSIQLNGLHALILYPLTALENHEVIANLECTITQAKVAIQQLLTQITQPRFPFIKRAFYGACLSVAMWSLGVPGLFAASFCAGLVIGFPLLSLSLPQNLYYELTPQIAEYFNKNGIKYLRDIQNEKLVDIYRADENIRVRAGIHALLQQHLGARFLVKTVVKSNQPNSDAKQEATHEVFSLVYNFPHLQDITRTQQRKMKGHAAQQSTQKATVTHDAKMEMSARKIEKPAGFSGELIECANHSLLNILPPVADSKVTQAEIDKTLDRKDRFARAFGQDGVKLLLNHTIWLKERNDNYRIKCVKHGASVVLVDGKEQSVPNYLPLMTVPRAQLNRYAK